MTSTLPLADGFPTFTEDDWLAAAAKARRGNDRGEGWAPVGGEGPLYPRRVGARPIAGRPAGQAWRIVERIAAATAPEAGRAAAEGITGGATGLDIVFSPSLHPLAGTMPASAAREVAAALAVAIPERLHIRVESSEPDPALLDAFVSLAAARKCELVFAFDPVAARALDPKAGDERHAAQISACAAAFDERGIDGAVVTADGRLWHAGGATEEQELGATLATFASHVRLLDAADRIGIALAADADQFRTIAKLRAMRLLLARVMEVGGIASPPPIHAETAWRMLSVRDPHMNILRATSAAFAAAAGGADSIAVLPFDAVAGGGTGAALRLARNTQLILMEEAHLSRVADPGAGAGAIEALTAAFAEGAWKRFQTIEAEGGIVAALAEGSLLRDVAEAREARLARVAKSDIKLIGINAFRGEAAATATVKRRLVKRTGPLTFKRLAAEFEATA